MHTPKSKWDVERAAAWLRKHTWGANGEERAPALEDMAVAVAAAVAAAAAVPEEERDEEIDIAGWPALVAPFYD